MGLLCRKQSYLHVVPGIIPNPVGAVHAFRETGPKQNELGLGPGGRSPVIPQNPFDTTRFSACSIGEQSVSCVGTGGGGGSGVERFPPYVVVLIGC